jgi:hypothetical protein
MIDSVVDHIQHLERSNRFWKRTCAILVAVLVSAVLFGLALWFCLANRMFG